MPGRPTLVSTGQSLSGEGLVPHGSAWACLQAGPAPHFASVDAEPKHRANPPKILLYSHDTFGLGNIQRTLLLADALQQEYRNAAILIVTGSPVIHDFRIPEGVDYVKLPCVDRVGPDQYEPRFLTTLTAEIAHVRRAVLKDTVLGFAPDLMIVDKRAGGVDGELVDTLQALQRRARATKLVLGVRDILDEPKRTRASLARGKFTMLVERYYDEVWIYGEPMKRSAPWTSDAAPAVTSSCSPVTDTRRVPIGNWRGGHACSGWIRPWPWWPRAVRWPFRGSPYRSRMKSVSRRHRRLEGQLAAVVHET